MVITAYRYSPRAQLSARLVGHLGVNMTSSKK